MKKIVILLTLCGLLLNANTASAAFNDEFMVIGDLAIARPLGLVVTAAGSAIFVVALPFALTSGSVKNTADVLVGQPFTGSLSQGPSVSLDRVVPLSRL